MLQGMMKSIRHNTFIKTVLSKKLSTVEKLPTQYSTGVQVMHWAMGGSMLACVGLVLAAQNTKDKALKSKCMFYHKSFGLLAFGMLFPRVYFRLASKLPGPVVGSNTIEALGATLSHYLMYGFIFFMPISGVVMGAYSGYGLPFFFTTLPSVDKNPAYAKLAYENHKVAGKALEYFVPVHVAGSFYHVLKGQTIFARIIGVLGK